MDPEKKTENGDTTTPPPVDKSTTSEEVAPVKEMGAREKMWRALNPEPKGLSDAEVEAEKKKQRRDGIISAIGDGVMALSNLFFTTKGAPNMYTGKNTMSERTKARYDKLVKDRDAKRAAWYNGWAKAKDADDAGSYRETLLKYKEAENTRAEAKETRDAALHDLKVQYEQGKIDEQTYKANKAKVEADFAERVQQSIIDKNNAAANASNAVAAKNNKTAEGEFMAYDADGTEHYFRSAEAAESFARQQGTWEDIMGTETNNVTGGNYYRPMVKKTEKVVSGRSVKPKKKNPML